MRMVSQKFAPDFHHSFENQAGLNEIDRPKSGLISANMIQLIEHLSDAPKNMA